MTSAGRDANAPDVLRPLLERVQRRCAGVVVRVGRASGRGGCCSEQQRSRAGRSGGMRERGGHRSAQRGRIGAARRRARPHGEQQHCSVGGGGRQRRQRRSERRGICVGRRRRHQAEARQKGQLLRSERRLRRTGGERGAERGPRAAHALAEPRHSRRRRVLCAEQSIKRRRRHDAAAAPEGRRRCNGGAKSDAAGRGDDTARALSSSQLTRFSVARRCSCSGCSCVRMATLYDSSPPSALSV